MGSNDLWSDHFATLLSLLTNVPDDFAGSAHPIEHPVLHDCPRACTSLVARGHLRRWLWRRCRFASLEHCLLARLLPPVFSRDGFRQASRGNGSAGRTGRPSRFRHLCGLPVAGQFDWCRLSFDHDACSRICVRASVIGYRPRSGRRPLLHRTTAWATCCGVSASIG